MSAEEKLEAIRRRIERLLHPDVARLHHVMWNDALREVLHWVDGEPMDSEIAQTIQRARRRDNKPWVIPE
jgi:hypothetical protein